MDQSFVGDQVFDDLPESFFRHLKDLMVLGVLPGDLVRELLGPLLARYDSLEPGLSPGLRNDVRNILAVYPEIAQAFGIKLTPLLVPYLSKLHAVLTGRFHPDLSGAESEIGGFSGLLPAELAAEAQGPFTPILHGFDSEGEGLLLTDRGTPVLLRLRYEPKEEKLYFEARGLSGPVGISVCGKRVLILSPGSTQSLPRRELVAIMEDVSPGEVELEITEEVSAGPDAG